jgi:inward rectifier potassium channel
LARSLSYRFDAELAALFALVLALDLLINFIFALLYVAEPGSVKNAAPGSLSDAFFFSIETLATVGYGEMAPGSLYGHIVAAIEIFCGMGFVAIIAGLLFVRFSRPRARILYAHQAVVGRFNGKRTLMIRIANGRAHPLTDTHARLTALFNEWSKEGQFYRRIYDLPLIRAHVPIFGLTWTLMHEINEKSPLYGYDQEAFREHVARIFLAIDARDPMLEAACTTPRIMRRRKSCSTAAMPTPSRSIRKAAPSPILRGSA